MSQLDLSEVTVPGTIRHDACDAVAYRVRRILLPLNLAGTRQLGMTMTIQAVTTDLRILSADDTTAENADGTALTGYMTCAAGSMVTVSLPLGGPAFRSICSATGSQAYKVEINRPVGGVA